MKVSVIMAVFNGENYVKSAIESILNQSFRDFEFIIVDDGSKDRTLEIINFFFLKDNRIKIIQNNQNLGLTKSLNKALNICNGDFIIRQDVDDVSLPKRIEKQIKFLIQNPEFAFCGCNGIIKQTKNDLLQFFETVEIKKNLIAQNCFYHSSIAVRMKILRKYGTYNKKYRYGQDYELMCRFVYKFNLKGKNLIERLIIANIPSLRFFKLNLFKFLSQRINDIRTKIKYFKFSQYKFKCIFAMFIKFIEIITFSYITEYFSGIFKKINI